jgi:hypothetical protein
MVSSFGLGDNQVVRLESRAAIKQVVQKQRHVIHHRRLHG